MGGASPNLGTPARATGASPRYGQSTSIRGNEAMARPIGASAAHSFGARRMSDLLHALHVVATLFLSLSWQSPLVTLSRRACERLIHRLDVGLNSMRCGTRCCAGTLGLAEHGSVECI